ncbi:NADP-dependent malic enzyme [Ehrlichia chaffeensis str. Heartland]|uniref:Malate dehydrogenase n=1 Tax=Ehrlichia chaffeensis (strain ATCC CRL-10679 / Arkansas) TaxID=205920 RepID=Q2GHT3_EHRCR|nr:NADP-dependent malic enzyme [Ehrlichia chaffeensis]ABD45280.1 malate dehydrogenase [Ehrlichia chaffeensis str. Arkansas]AHX04031.1 NADP-dependent malic enzyme [Ehrlichia chaffeensis str. Heartland]AHX05965.1 NADP-dependent malic enzyme [Ehrlichia chaffeensis str. Jax]AHX06955.1 NADP-dependent malic enzyme [Ehrlichia chaffeensis str. Liberty]AHX07364.1 NADP-dependent malic enzyme [Ehrlichia chaffeensis str. Osceola]
MVDLENNGFDEKRKEALEFHCKDLKPGKVSLLPTKPLLTQRDLSLAYSPGVAVPCLEIARNPDLVYEYTARGNYVAVISNGTAVLGLGNIGPLASKPVMEGKAVLFKRFADIDAVDIEVNTSDVDEFVNTVKYLGLSWGGINLEDIKAPECFIIEKRLSEIMDIPVFHDDQHGTAIIVAAGLINALDITGKSFKDVKIVINGAGAAGIACLEMIKLIGVPAENITLCDQNGVIYKGRQLGMNEWKEKHAIETENRSLKDALIMADVFLGLSVKDVLSKDMLLSMNRDPVIFALANPDPEINPNVAHEIRPDAIIATGRSDYNNQINNVMGFPYIFRGALDVRAKSVNNEMKIAAANAIAMLAREYVSDEVSDAYGGRKMNYGKDYIIPTPFDPRLITVVSPAVAKAAIDSGVARKNIENWDEYTKQLASRLSLTSNILSMMYSAVKCDPKRVIFSEGEEEKVIEAAVQWRNQEYGLPILVGRIDKVQEAFDRLGIKDTKGIEIANAAISQRNNEYTDYLYKKLQREGYLYRSCVRDVKTDRNVFAACMLACGDGDVLITGMTRGYYASINDVQKVIGSQGVVFGLSIIVMKERTIFVADTAIHESPTPEQIAEIAIQASVQAKKMGYEPRVSFISSSNFGSHSQEDAKKMRQAIKILDSYNVSFEYDGEMSVDTALNPELLTLYPFCKLTGEANVLVMPTLHSASISSKLLQRAAGVSVIGPILIGMEKPVQIVQMSSSVSEILNLTVLASLVNNTNF